MGGVYKEMIGCLLGFRGLIKVCGLGFRVVMPP